MTLQGHNELHQKSAGINIVSNQLIRRHRFCSCELKNTSNRQSTSHKRTIAAISHSHVQLVLHWLSDGPSALRLSGGQTCHFPLAYLHIGGGVRARHGAKSLAWRLIGHSSALFPTHPKAFFHGIWCTTTLIYWIHPTVFLICVWIWGWPDSKIFVYMEQESSAIKKNNTACVNQGTVPSHCSANSRGTRILRQKGKIKHLHMQCISLIIINESAACLLAAHPLTLGKLLIPHAYPPATIFISSATIEGLSERRRPHLGAGEQDIKKKSPMF